MDLEKYYDERNGGFVIHFANSSGLSLDEIREKFSTYGKILSLSQPKGLVFITYEDLNDTLNAIRSSRADTSMRILPHKRKCEKKENEILSVQKTGFKNSELCKNNTNTHKLNESSVCTSRESINVNNPSRSSLLHLQNRNHKKSQQSIPNASSLSSITNDYAKGIPISDTAEIPPLISNDDKYKLHSTSLAKSKTVLLAHEVVVANIHFNISIHYILHLFNKYNPLCVSFMKTTPDTGVRYCHVYYETKEEANATVREFDSYCLLGKNLIVLTPRQLIEEAS